MVPSDSDVQNAVKTFIVTNFFLDTSTVTIESGTSFLESGIIDSTGILDVIGFLEDTYEIKVEDSEMLPENLDSLGNIAAYVLRKKTAVS